MRVRCGSVIVVVGVLVGVASCSSAPDPGPPPDPCTVAGTVIARAQAAIGTDPGSLTAQQAHAERDFYSRAYVSLTLGNDASGLRDVASAAARLAQDYTTVAGDAGNGGVDAGTSAQLASDLRELAGGGAAVDAACAGRTPSPTAS